MNDDVSDTPYLERNSASVVVGSIPYKSDSAHCELMIEDKRGETHSKSIISQENMPSPLHNLTLIETGV